MEICDLLSARRHLGWRVYTALRPVIAVLLMILMAGNAMAGSFSGFAHAHDGVQIGHHHHHDGEDHYHHDNNKLDCDANTLPAAMDDPTISSSDRGTEQGQIHVHEPIVALGLAKVAEWVPRPIQPTWALRSPDQLVSDQRIPSERPPRVA